MDQIVSQNKDKYRRIESNRQYNNSTCIPPGIILHSTHTHSLIYPHAHTYTHKDTQTQSDTDRHRQTSETIGGSGVRRPNSLYREGWGEGGATCVGEKGEQ